MADDVATVVDELAGAFPGLGRALVESAVREALGLTRGDGSLPRETRLRVATGAARLALQQLTAADPGTA